MDLRTESKKTLQLAIPVILGELAQVSLHIIDTAMIGSVSYKHLAAAALVLNFINIPFIFGIGLTIAMAQMVSLAHGKNDKQLVSHYFYNGFWVCSIGGVFISLALFFSADLLTHLKQDPEVVELAKPFLKLMSLSILPMMLFMTLKQFADGLQFTKTAMILSVLAIPINVFLNWIMIYGNWGFPRMELVGAGYATLITRTLIFVLLAIVILKFPVFRKYMAVAKSQWKLNKLSIRQVLKIGIPSSLQIGMEAGAFAVSGIIIGTISASAQAAHQIALTCASTAFMVMLGLSQAASIRVSHAMGSRNWTKIGTIGKSTFMMALLYGGICCTLFILFRNVLPAFFNDNAEVISIAAGLLLFAAFFQFSDATQVISAGLLRGIKDVNIPTIYIAIAYWVIGLPVGYLLAFHFGWGASGIWIGLILGLTFTSIMLSIRFFRNTRKKIALDQ